MDPPKYWMLARRKLSEKPLLAPHIAGVGVSSSYCESWEERAFAEDSAGHLGGCIWPPRSYSCNFCGREFRSAQALGGHMNVHRRDRARLKLSADDTGDAIPHQTSSYLRPCPPPPFATPYSSQIGPLSCNPNPNPNANPNPNSIRGVLLHPPSPSRPFAAAAKSSVLSPPLVFSSAGEDHGKKLSDLLAFQPEAVVHHRHTQKRDFEDDGEIAAGSKRRRVVDIAVSPFFLNSSSGKHQQRDDDDDDDDAEVLQLCASSPVVEELDLELRLGEAPKVK